MAKVHRRTAALYSLRLTLVIVCIQGANAPPLYDALKCEIPEFDSAYFAGYPKPAWVKRNEQLIFRCNEKYYDRPTYSTCAGENLWEKPFPPCQLVRCPDSAVIPHGKTSTVTDPGVGDNMMIDCDEGYWFTGSHTRICQRTGKWDGNEGQCKRIECEELDVQNGTLSKLPPYYYNTDVHLICNEGFVSTNPSGIKCQGDRTWSGHIGKCKEISEIWCPSTKSDNMRVDPDKRVYVYKETININCDEGFIYNGTTKRTCGVKTWNGTDGICNRIYCDKPTFIIKKGKFGTCNPCPYGTKLTVTCEEGYILQNNTNPICRKGGATGKWLIVDIICEAARCDGAPIIKNGFIVGNKSGVFKDERPVQCYPEFHYQGPDKIKCLHDGQWSYPGNCNEHDPKVAVKIVIPLVVFMLLLVLLGAIIIFRHRTNGTVRLRKSICKGGHSVENRLDEKIDLDKHFIPLRLVDEGKNIRADEDGMMDKYLSYLKRYDKLQNIEMDNLIAGLGDGGVIVIQGRAGVGKTTLIQKLAWDWAKEKWAQSYKALFIYNMRYISPKDKRLMTLAEFLEQYMLHRPGYLKSIISNGIKSQGEGMIIFMDAIDEFPNLLQYLEKAERINTPGENCSELPATKWCMLLWTAKVLSKAVVILTSRHIKELKILNPKKNIEVLGLTPHALRQMVDSQIEDKTKAAGLKNVLKNNQILMSASSITFFCLMLCKTFIKSQNFTETTKSLQTYTRIIYFVIQSFLRRNQTDDSEETPLNQTEILKLQPFTKLAHMGLCEHQDNIDLAQLVFDDEDIKEAGITDTDLVFAQELGLIVCSEQVPLQGKQQRIIEFVHLSIQELLAMTYLVKREPSTAVDMFNSMWDTKRFHMAQLYLFGLCFDEGISDAQLLMPKTHHLTDKLKHSLSQALAQKAAKAKKDRFQVLRAIQAAYETGNADVSKEVAMALFKDKKIILRDLQLTAVDFLGIIAMIDSHGEITEIRLDRVLTDESSLTVLSTFLSKNDTIETLSLHSVSLKEESFSSLMDAVSRNSRLKHLFLDNTDINDNMMSKLKDLLEANICLEEISIAHNKITDVGIVMIAEALAMDIPLQKLILDTGRMDMKYIGALAYLTERNTKFKILLRGTPLEPKLQVYIDSVPSLRERICFELAGMGTDREDEPTSALEIETCL